jgi:chemotaxis protein methyltransferase WspC
MAPPPATGAVPTERRGEPRPSRDAQLARAQQAADEGQLGEARTICAELLGMDSGDVRARYLLGLVALADNDLAGADAAFVQVLYLDRDHVDALEHRAALAVRRGDIDEAQRLKARSRRLRQRLGRSPRA